MISFYHCFEPHIWQVDSFATARDGETHEATRRLLSVLLRQVLLEILNFLITSINICEFETMFRHSLVPFGNLLVYRNFLKKILCTVLYN